MDCPKVSVVMALYNARKYVEQTIASILNQTFQDFELLIVDDASTDGSAEIVTSINDPRIRLIRNEKNLGQGQSRNRGMKLCRGEYLAHMDADDLARPTRLALQSEFLDSHPEIAVVGGDIVRIDADGRPLATQYKNPHTWGKIKWIMPIHCCVPQPAVMVRRVVFEMIGGYESVWSEDYTYWLTAIQNGFRIWNLPIPLLDYRVHPQSYSHYKFAEQRRSSVESVRTHVRQLMGIDLKPSLIEDSFSLGEGNASPAAAIRVFPFYARIAWKSFQDRESTWTDFLFILRRMTSRLGIGFLKSTLGRRKKSDIIKRNNV